MRALGEAARAPDPPKKIENEYGESEKTERDPKKQSE